MSQIAGRCSKVGEWNVDHVAQPAHEGEVDVVLEVRGEDRQAAIALHALEQVADLDIGVAVVAVLHFAALAEQRVGLVEETAPRPRLRGIEHFAKFFSVSPIYF